MTADKHNRFYWVLLALFFGAQMLVAQHTFEFGVKKHTHHGQECSFQLFAEQAKAPTLPTLPPVPVATILSSAERPTLLVHVASIFERSLFARAPPISIA